ncbi:MAG: hypothetical protein J5858_00215 [Lentisphaeria bacterium]|nr:hypothetical protein [Lentisphaeria bacterium]
MLNITYSEKEMSVNLSHAILFYQSDSGDTLATVHGVENNKLLAGKSVSLQDVEELFHTKYQQKKMILIPSEIVAWSRNEVLWFEKSQIRPMFYNVPESSRQYLNEISGKNVIWPNLLFRISRFEIYCWALKSNQKPTLDTTLYRAPFTNIFNDSRFCPPTQFREIHEENIIEFARKAVDVFYRGHFSHLYGDMKRSLTYSCGRDRFWVKMADDLEKGKRKSFPSKYLVPTNLTLRSVLS